jgi:hypothetical protein
MVVENEELPAWLVELRQQQFADQPEEQPSVVEGRRERPVQGGMAEAPRTPMAQPEPRMARPTQPAQPAPPESAAPADVLGDLREQMLQAEDDLEYQEGPTPSAIIQSITELRPTQRLLLSILLFLNVALCGCMVLIMAGRVELPF